MYIVASDKQESSATTMGVDITKYCLTRDPLATRRYNVLLCMVYTIAHTAVGDPWAKWMTTTKQVTHTFHAWRYTPIYRPSLHNIHKFSFLHFIIIIMLECSIAPFRNIQLHVLLFSFLRQLGPRGLHIFKIMYRA